MSMLYNEINEIGHEFDIFVDIFVLSRKNI